MYLLSTLLAVLPIVVLAVDNLGDKVCCGKNAHQVRICVDSCYHALIQYISQIMSILMVIAAHKMQKPAKFGVRAM